MTRLKLILALLAGLGATAATAQTVEDANGDGMYQMEELMVVYPALTEDVFGQIDQNGDGGVDAEEFAAAQEAGLLAAG